MNKSNYLSLLDHLREVVYGISSNSPLSDSLAKRLEESELEKGRLELRLINREHTIKSLEDTNEAILEHNKDLFSAVEIRDRFIVRKKLKKEFDKLLSNS